MDVYRRGSVALEWRSQYASARLYASRQLAKVRRVRHSSNLSSNSELAKKEKEKKREQLNPVEVPFEARHDWFCVGGGMFSSVGKCASSSHVSTTVRVRVAVLDCVATQRRVLANKYHRVGVYSTHQRYWTNKGALISSPRSTTT